MRSHITVSSFASIVVQLVFLSRSPSAHAAFVQVLPGPVDRVVAARDQIAAIRGGEVLILQENGSTLRGITEADHRGASDSSVDAKHATEHMLDLLDVAEIDRGTDFSDELVENERTLAQRRAAKSTPLRPISSFVPTGLVANEAGIWLIHGDIRQLSIGGHVARVWGREGFRAPAAASSNGLLVTKASDLVFLDLRSGSKEKIGSASDVNSVAVSRSAQRRASATAAFIVWLGPDGGRKIAASGTSDLVFCDELLVGLAADALVLVSPDGRTQTHMARPGARRLFCSQDPATPWILVADELWASSDHGRHWQLLERPTAARMVDVAASTHRLWLATNDGLYASSDGMESAAPSLPSPQRKERHVRPPSAFSWLPKISLRAGANLAQGRQEWEALAFAAFPIDGRALPLVNATVMDDFSPQAEQQAQPQRADERSAELRDYRDPNQECLRTARRKAIELALAEPERARSYISRAGYAAWLPELRLLLSRRYGRSESIDINSSSTALSSPLGIDTVNDVRYEARATWDLSKLVFSSEELAAQAQAIHMAELRRDIETTVNRLYFERRSLDRSGDQVTRRGPRTGEVEAELDALSGGAFASCMAGKAGSR